MKRIAVLLMLAMLTPELTAQPIAGTYEIWVCKGSCVMGDTTRALAWGQLVLNDAPIRLDALSESARRLLSGFDESPNACWAVKRSVHRTDTYAGVSSVGTTQWSQATVDAPLLRFRLFRSPDAFHDVVAVVRDGVLRGTGKSSGGYENAMNWPVDSIVGRRVGAPNVTICLDAARARRPLTAADMPVPQPSETPIATRAAATLSVPGFPDFLVADGDAVWTTNRGRIEKLVHDQPAPVASVAIARPCGAMAAGFGAIWVADCGERAIKRVDTQTNTVVATIPTGLADPRGEISLATGAGSVWVLTDTAGVLSRIDPATNQVIARIPVAHRSYAVVFGFGAVWITNTDPTPGSPMSAVQRIDPATNRVVATIPVGPTPRFLAAGEGAVWTLNQGDGTVTRIDPTTNRAIATISVGAVGGGGDIAAGAGRVWVRSTRVLLVAINPALNAPSERLGPPAGSGAVRVAGDRVWVTAHDVRTVWVIKP